VREILFTAADNANHPYRAYPGDAGFDLSCLNAGVVAAGALVDLPTGLAVQLPDDTWALVMGRSSAAGKGFLVIQSVIDQGYRGPLYVRVWNFTQNPITVLEGERLGQLIPLPLTAVDIVARRVDQLETSERNTNGFGSSG
jgi:dUTP pyrophosphatase